MENAPYEDVKMYLIVLVYSIRGDGGGDYFLSAAIKLVVPRSMEIINPFNLATARCY